MPSLGPLEILVIFIVALLIFGPNKLPELARQVGKGLAEFRKVQHHLRGELDDAIHSVMEDDKPKVAPPVVPAVTPVLDAASAVDVPAVEPIATPPIETPPIEPPPMATPPIEPPSVEAVDEPAPETPTAEPGPTPPPLADDA